MPKPTAKQVDTFEAAMQLWKDKGEMLAGKMMPNGNMLVTTISAGTIDHSIVTPDGHPGRWF